MAAWWRTLSEARRQVLISMCFNLSVGGLFAFKQMLGACERGDSLQAAEEMLASNRPARSASWPRSLRG